MTAETAGPSDARADAHPDRVAGPVVGPVGGAVCGAVGEGPTVPTVPTVPRRSPAFADGLWVDRIGTRRYVGHNTRGAQVLVGPVAAGSVFTPGELMKIALAGCSGMSADAALARRLGDDVPISVHVSGPSDPAEVRYPTLHEELVVDLSGLSREDRSRVETVIRRAIDRSCTVGRTLQQSASVELTVSSCDDGRPATHHAATSRAAGATFPGFRRRGQGMRTPR
jgi:uncharacterized OsmC-like protein